MPVGVVAGIAPVLGLKSVAPGEALKDAGRAITGDRRFAARGTLVVAQLAVSLVLVVAAGLFLRTFASLNRLPLGFVPEPLLVVELNLQTSGESIEARPRARRASARRRGGGPGRAIGDRLGGAASDGRRVEQRHGCRRRGSATPGGPRAAVALARRHDARLVRAMGIPLRGGRDFDDGDRVGSPPVAIVNEAFVRQYLPGRQPIGETVRLGGRGDEESRWRDRRPGGRYRLRDDTRGYGADDVRPRGAAGTGGLLADRPADHQHAT